MKTLQEMKPQIVFQMNSNIYKKGPILTNNLELQPPYTKSHTNHIFEFLYVWAVEEYMGRDLVLKRPLCGGRA